jgi:hypothetical protein
MRCTHGHSIYTPPPVKLNSKVGLFVILAGSALLGTGCGGINASHSVSPASFILPGLLKAEPQTADPLEPLPVAAPVEQFARAN